LTGRRERRPTRHCLNESVDVGGINPALRYREVSNHVFVPYTTVSVRRPIFSQRAEGTTDAFFGE
jgi:hypothetical protein